MNEIQVLEVYLYMVAQNQIQYNHSDIFLHYLNIVHHFLVKKYGLDMELLLLFQELNKLYLLFAILH